MFRGSLVALITPFLANGEIDYEAFRNLVVWHIEQNTNGVVIAGTTGEGPTLSTEEEVELLKIAMQESRGRIPVIMGTGSNDTKTSIAKTQQAKNLGADACLVIVPYYNKPTFEGCVEHYRRIAEVNLPVIIYHHPGRTGIKFSASQLCQLASIRGVVGIKESSGDMDLAAELIRNSSTVVFSGDDSLTLPMIALGAQGVISVAANVIPKQWSLFCDLCLKGQFYEAKKEFDKAADFCKALFLEVNPQPVKYAVSLLKRCEPHLRLPLLPPKEDVKIKISKALHDVLYHDQLKSIGIDQNILSTSSFPGYGPQHV
jgi:4-hydroxy-tetrahydrodipicolinate synthase